MPIRAEMIFEEELDSIIENNSSNLHLSDTLIPLDDSTFFFSIMDRCIIFYAASLPSLYTSFKERFSLA